MAATFTLIMFTTQKNGVVVETIGYAKSDSSLFCPIRALARHVLHLCTHKCPPSTPLCTYFTPSSGKSYLLRSAAVIAIICVLNNLNPQLDIPLDNITAHSLRASGAMALRCAKVDPNIIRLIGCWQPDAMFCYLHI